MRAELTMISRRQHCRSASLPVPAPLRPSELAQLNLPPLPQEDDLEDEQWTRFSSKVGRLAGRGSGDSWGWSGSTSPSSTLHMRPSPPSKALHAPPPKLQLERRSTAPPKYLATCLKTSRHDRDAPSTSPAQSTSCSSRSSASSVASSPRVHFLDPLPPTEDDATDTLIRRLLASHDTTGWCSLVERALEFPIPDSMGPQERRSLRSKKQMKSLSGLADTIERGDLGRCRSDPLLSTMVLKHDDEPMQEDDVPDTAGSWWKLGDLMALL